MITRRALWIVVLLVAPCASAHKPSDSYLSIDLRGDRVAGRWDIALRDLEHAVGLDADGDGAITWGELRGARDAVRAYALSGLTLRVGGDVCALRLASLQVDRHSDGAYAVLGLSSSCPADAFETVRYRLLFDLDPTHRGLVKLQTPERTLSAVLSPQRPTLSGEVRGGWQTFRDYWRAGVGHVWSGADHLLFLLTLLLPAVLVRERSGWRSAASPRAVLLDAAGIVTAFTVAHSLTLSAAVLGWVTPPSRWVETAIAATVLLAALSNLLSWRQTRRWRIGFLLGLVHGFGFAGALAGLDLSAGVLTPALAGFNLGVETGQLAAVIGFLPVAYALRGTRFYRRAVVPIGSLAVAAIASSWLIERGLAAPQ